METFNMHEAKTNLSKLVDKALNGEDIILARNGKAVIKLVPIQTAQERPLGLHATKLSNEEALEALNPISESDVDFYQQNDL